MSQDAIKQVEKAGTSITKEKLLEKIRSSNSKLFTYSQSLNSPKVLVVVITP